MACDLNNPFHQSPREAVRLSAKLIKYHIIVGSDLLSESQEGHSEVAIHYFV